jgi:hypothetical protein
MGNSVSDTGLNYSSAEIKQVANLLGIPTADKVALMHLSEKLERAVFDYKLASEDKFEEPMEPPSKLIERVTPPAIAIQNAIDQIQSFPRQMQSDLVTIANKTGDEVGRKSGAVEFFETIDQLPWIIKCLDELAKKYQNNVTQAGGNRKDIARKLFYDNMNNILIEWHEGSLKGWVEDYSNKQTGPLPEFLKVCFSPIKSKPTLNTLVKAFREQLRG